MVALRTLATGCAILTTAAGAAAATLECTTASGPAGGQVALEVRLATDPGEEVAGTQNDLLLDTAAFDAAEPGTDSPHCRINRDIGPGSAPDKRLARAFVDGDPGMVRGIIISQQNQLPIPPGPLYTCTLQIAADAERRAYTIDLAGAIASDTAGDRLPTEAQSCLVTVTEPTPTRTPTPEDFCEDDEDCDENERCIENRCVPFTPTPQGFCEDDEDCAPGEICVDERCVTPSPSPTPEGFCEDDEDCPEGFACIENRCVLFTPTPDGFCEDDEDCAPGEICVDERCATPSPTPRGFCEDDEDCPPGEVCVDQRCATPTPTRDEGGGGCDCSIQPDPPRRAVLNLLLAALPILWLRLGRRSRR